MAEAQFALAYRGILDAGLIGPMDMRDVQALSARLKAQMKAEKDHADKMAQERAAAARRSRGRRRR